MNHFSAEEWIDFARGVLPTAMLDTMQATLDQGCVECRDSLHFWQTILTSVVYGQDQPSTAVVNAVKRAYTAEKSWDWIIATAHFAEVVFDSFREPGLAGTRSFPDPTHQIIVKSEPFVIDLQIVSDLIKQRVSLTGQVLHSESSQAEINGADVVLLSVNQLVKKTKANNLGEFYLDFNQQESLRLFINIRGRRAIGITLPDLKNEHLLDGLK